MHIFVGRNALRINSEEGMNKEKRSREEIVTAFKKSVILRSRWESAVQSGVSSEEKDKMGLKTIDIQEFFVYL